MSRALHRANRRQRKKKHLGEFQELGFMIEAQLAADMDETQRDAFMERFLTEAIDANGLEFAGGFSEDFGGFVVSAKAYGEVGDEHRELLRKWLEQQGELKEAQVGELRDAWYGWG